MNNVYFGVFIGIFLYFGGERFIKMLIKALKERKVNNDKRLVEIVNQIVNKGE